MLLCIESWCAGLRLHCCNAEQGAAGLPAVRSWCCQMPSNKNLRITAHVPGPAALAAVPCQLPTQLAARHTRLTYGPAHDRELLRALLVTPAPHRRLARDEFCEVGPCAELWVKQVVGLLSSTLAWSRLEGPPRLVGGVDGAIHLHPAAAVAGVEAKPVVPVPGGQQVALQGGNSSPGVMALMRCFLPSIMVLTRWETTDARRSAELGS